MEPNVLGYLQEDCFRVKSRSVKRCQVPGVGCQELGVRRQESGDATRDCRSTMDDCRMPMADCRLLLAPKLRRASMPSPLPLEDSSLRRMWCLINAFGKVRQGNTAKKKNKNSTFKAGMYMKTKKRGQNARKKSDIFV